MEPQNVQDPVSDPAPVPPASPKSAGSLGDVDVSDAAAEEPEPRAAALKHKLVAKYRDMPNDQSEDSLYHRFRAHDEDVIDAAGSNLSLREYRQRKKDEERKKDGFSA